MKLTNYVLTLVPPTRYDMPNFECEDFRNRMSRHMNAKWLGPWMFELSAEDQRDLAKQIKDACSRAKFSEYGQMDCQLRCFKIENEINIEQNIRNLEMVELNLPTREYFLHKETMI